MRRPPRETSPKRLGVKDFLFGRPVDILGKIYMLLLGIERQDDDIVLF